MQIVALLAGGLLAAAAASAAADEVVLRNGDRLSGTVVHLAKGKLTLRTVYAGELELEWDRIASVRTDAPVRVVRRGATAPERLRLAPGIALDDIVYLNPAPYESGAGIAYSGRAALAASYVRGNAESERLYADGELTARAREYRATVSATTERRADPATPSSAAWRAAANYDRFLTERRFVYVRGSLEHDRLKDIDRRTAVGTGYGAQLADSERASVSVRGGIDYVTVKRSVAPDEGYPAFGWAVKAEVAPWGARLRLFHEHEGFWNLEDSAQVFVRSKTGLRMPLVARLSATAQVNVDWERQPAPGRKSTDTTLLLGLDYSF